MKFSIRTLLALVAVAAFAMVALRSYRKAITEQNRSVQLELAIESLEQQQVVQVDYRETKLAQDDLNASLQDNRDLCEQAIKVLVERYGLIKPVDAETLSIRRSPAIRADTSHAPILFKLFVPEDRPIWLKFGLHPQSTSAPSDRVAGSEDVLLGESAFNPSGPFELKLPPGEHEVAFLMEGPENAFGRFQVRLNSEVLAQPTVIAGSDVRRSGHMSISADQQVDFAPNRTLPRLVTFQLRQYETKDSESTKEFNLSVWLSDRSSSFSPFSALH